MDEPQVVDMSADDTHALRRAVLRTGTPSDEVEFEGDREPGAYHLGVAVGGDVVAISTWLPRSFHGAAAVQLRGMATDPRWRGRGLGTLLLEAGCRRAAVTVPVVWARARDSALEFYLAHGFEVEGDGFVDATTGLPHHIIWCAVTERWPAAS